mgnify:CR=1 FL=1
MIYTARRAIRARIHRAPHPRPSWHPCHLPAWRLVEIALARLTGWRWRTYDDYLRSRVWAWKRERALARDGRACKLCAGRGGLQVHHRAYVARWGRESDDDLVTLCARCHRTFHGREIGRAHV